MLLGSQHHLKLIVLTPLLKYISVKGKEELVSLYCLDLYVGKLKYADERLLEGKLHTEVIED